MKITITDNLYLKNGIWYYEINFSDNKYIMVYENKNIFECQKIKSILDNRILKYFKKEISILKTSDLNLTYIKK